MATTSSTPASSARNATAEAFLDAAERLLVEVGYAGITTRRLAAEANANQGLVHYYFGSIDALLAQVVERFTERLVERQREMYGADAPFIEKWRTAWRFQQADIEAGYSKIWMELQALSWNRPNLRPVVERVNAEWRGVLRDAFERAAEEYGLVPKEFPVDALVALMMTFGQGYAIERLEGIDEGHRTLLNWIDGWLEDLESRRER
jgi:AcrR family transcriptional regulator